LIAVLPPTEGESTCASSVVGTQMYLHAALVVAARNR
jgi:hypothetical protein